MKKAAFFGWGALIWKFIADVLGNDSLVFEIMTMFWFFDMFLGTLLAVVQKQFRTSKFLYGLVKWWVATVLIFTAWGFRIAPPPDDDFIAFLVESAVLYMFAHSLIKNAVKLFRFLSDDPNPQPTILEKVLGIMTAHEDALLNRFKPGGSQEVVLEKVQTKAMVTVTTEPIETTRSSAENESTS